jgi:fructose-bisphosphate aldolase, class I
MQIISARELPVEHLTIVGCDLPNPAFYRITIHWRMGLAARNGFSVRSLTTDLQPSTMSTPRESPVGADQPKTLEIESTALALVARGKGILAADESFPTIGRRFAELNIPSTEESRRAYRELLLTTSGLQQFISGAILFEETLRQKTSDGVPFPEHLQRHGIIPGIKVDKGTIDFPGSAGEKLTTGLDGLRERLADYRQAGARFTKWRAVIAIRRLVPTSACLEANANALAIFAALSQEAGLVPIVEPEVLMDGDHTLARCEEVTDVTLDTVFSALSDHGVALEQMLLKTAMVLPGEQSAAQADAGSVAKATLRSLNANVPAAVPGIVFLSGGQSDQAATQRLNAICATTDTPWKLSFSFGRALQAPALKTWAGQHDNLLAAQNALRHRARCNSFAIQGAYSADMERAT